MLSGEALRVVGFLLENRSFNAKDFLGKPTPVPERIEIYGRRWNRKTYGGVYFTCKIYVNDKLVHTVPMNYGDGDHYVEVATQWLEEEGYIPRRSESEYGMYQPGWFWIRDVLKIPFSYKSEDVPRQRDLHR